MDNSEVESLVKQLATGFDVLQEEYQKLFGQYQGLERKLATAREQYNELAKLCDSGSVTTPPLSLSSSPRQRHTEPEIKLSVSTILEQRPDASSQLAAQSVHLATQTASLLRGVSFESSASGVRIWSGLSADRLKSGNTMMPSISESPLEQDFTVEGKPSKLGCPFASMAGKKLSSHAASVLSRYNPTGSATASLTNGEAVNSARSSVSRINGRQSLAKRSASERRTSFADPIKAEICGMDSHQRSRIGDEDRESPMSERAAFKPPVSQQQQQQEVGVCPIRFLDQHSPEEVATYFERHKHELPRSHEVCVKRYQSNEKQIRELDEKYGNLVSMIQGLGQKHQNLLPKDRDDEEAGDDDAVEDDEKRDEQVRKWASSISAQAGQDEVVMEEERTPHFERPLRDIRVGESPSRPWGIYVPAKYTEEEAARSEASTSPVKVNLSGLHSKEVPEAEVGPVKCPFDFNNADASPSEDRSPPHDDGPSRPQFTKAKAQDTRLLIDGAKARVVESSPGMVFTGPVFIGYSAEDAAKILRGSGLGGPS